METQFTPEAYAEMRSKALEQLKNGSSLFGKDGAFGPMLKDFLEAALEAEMSVHLDEQERQSGNKRNGKGSKRVKTFAGEIDIATPQDRHSNFSPEIIRKRETILSDNLAPKIIALYGRGMSFRDISEHIKEMYDVDISHATLSEITERIIPKVKEWQCRPLESVYPIVFLDAIHYKVRENGQVSSRAVYNVLGIDSEGNRDIIGMYISESEGANFWLSVLMDLQNRGVKDILIACIDNLKGFAEAIETVFPQVEIQSCIIHQIRNTIKYVSNKDQREFLADLKTIYKASTRVEAELNFEKLAMKWSAKYPLVISSWERNWERLTTYFSYNEHIRKMIYTTNIIEGFHRQLRKVTKTKGVFPNDMALLKLIYLVSNNNKKKGSQKLLNWGITAQQLHLRFGDRMPLDM